jgi:Holliday junction resolvase RusA-like endonuclease
MTIKFTVPIRPEGKRESRSVAMPLKGKDGRPVYKNGRPVYTTRQHKDAEQRRYEDVLGAEIIRHRPETPIDVPVILTVRVYVSMPSYIRDTWRRNPAEQGLILPGKKPDLSNYLKAVEDVMTRAGYWTDDSRIVRYGFPTGKFYSMNPRWEIEVMPLPVLRTLKEYNEFLATDNLEV